MISVVIGNISKYGINEVDLSLLTRVMKLELMMATTCLYGGDDDYDRQCRACVAQCVYHVWICKRYISRYAAWRCISFT